MDRTQKKNQVDEIQYRFARMVAAVFTDFRGLNVESMGQLRNEFRKIGVEYKVVKNTLVKLALKEQDYCAALSEFLVGPTAVAWSYEDPIAPAKVVVDFSKGHENLKIKCGVLDGQVLRPEAVEQLSKMPGRDAIRGSMLATLVAPAQQFVRLLAAAPTNFLYLMGARGRSLEGE